MQIYPKGVGIVSNVFINWALGAPGTRHTVNERFRTNKQTDIMITQKTVPNLAQQEDSKFDLFIFLSASHSSMVPRASLVRLLGPKTYQNAFQIACANQQMDTILCQIYNVVFVHMICGVFEMFPRIE